MAPFEILYGRRCRTPIFWNDIGEHQVFGPDIIQDTEKQVQLVREKLKVSHRVSRVSRSWAKGVKF
jgi:hypothetical protein